MEAIGLLLAQTTVGVARVEGARYQILDLAPGTSLSGLVKSGAVDRLTTARVIATLDRDEVTLRPPITAPGKLLVVGLNYRDHARELGVELPRVPRVHLSAPSAVAGPCDDIPLPAVADSSVDFEGELAVVIGVPARDVAIEQAWSHVAGVTVVNDVSARDVQRGSNPAVDGANVGLAKGFDGFKPLGPALLTPEDLRDGRSLALQTRVDGQVRQRSATGEMHYSVAELVSQLSRYFTLQSGDIILTGTPGGVALSSGRFLRAGQLVEVELEGIGTLRNRVVATTKEHPHNEGQHES